MKIAEINKKLNNYERKPHLDGKINNFASKKHIQAVNATGFEAYIKRYEGKRSSLIGKIILNILTFSFKKASRLIEAAKYGGKVIGVAKNTLTPKNSKSIPARSSPPQFLRTNQGSRPAPSIDFTPAGELPIIQPRQTVREYIGAEFKGQTATAQKYSSRLNYISQYYGKSTIWPVRGDGNCFGNVIVAAIISKMSKDPSFIPKVLTVLNAARVSNDPYITPDQTTTAPSHSRNFSKDGDFQTVIRKIQEQAQSIEALADDFNFATAFSRIIRYLIASDEESLLLGNSLTSGDELDMASIAITNKIFPDLRGVAVVLATPTEAGGDFVEPHKFAQIQGTSTEASQVDVSQASSPPRCDFVLIRKNAHFIALTSSLS